MDKVNFADLYFKKKDEPLKEKKERKYGGRKIRPKRIAWLCEVCKNSTYAVKVDDNNYAVEEHFKPRAKRLDPIVVCRDMPIQPP